MLLLQLVIQVLFNGVKNFGNYLGNDDKQNWYKYDPTHLIKQYTTTNDYQPSILIHQV